MFFFAQYVVPLALIGLSGLLLDAHRRAWRTAQNDDRLSERDRRFARSQYLRRTQASSIIGLVGAALACYPLLPQEPVAIVIYLAALVGACLCMMLLAMLDLLATRYNFQRIQNEQLAAQVKTARQLPAAGKSNDAQK